jgi:hypothetical protein
VWALVAGLAAAAYWFSKLDIPPHNAGQRKALLFWVGLLLAPAILALRYLWVLVVPNRNWPKRVWTRS